MFIIIYISLRKQPLPHPPINLFELVRRTGRTEPVLSCAAHQRSCSTSRSRGGSHLFQRGLARLLDPLHLGVWSSAAIRSATNIWR
jgi:hypothetical protein